MDLSNDLISQFVKMTNDTEKKQTQDTTLYGTVVEYGDGHYVQLDGSDLMTPVDTTVDIQADDRVTVMIKKHGATVTGNISNPSASISRLESVDGHVSIVEQTADKINWIVSSGTSSANMTLTSNALSAIAENIDLTGKVTFSSLDDDLQGDIEVVYDVKNDVDDVKDDIDGVKSDVNSWKYSDTTLIDGGKIYTGSITADKINVNNLAVSGELLTGVLNGVNGIYLGQGASIYGAMYGYKSQTDTTERWRISSDGWGSFDGAEFDSDVTVGDQLTTNGNIVGKGNLTLTGTMYVSTVNSSSYNWRITSGGWVYASGFESAGNTNIGGNLDVSGHTYVGALTGSDWSVSSSGWCYFEDGGQFNANVTCSGRITGGSFYTTGGTYIGSDRNIKENIQYINSESAAMMLLDETESDSLTTSDMLEFIETIPLVKYDLKQEYEIEEGSVHYGFIIQDIADTKVGKEIVHIPSENDDIGYMTYSEENLITVLIGALQAEIKARKGLEQYVMNMKGE